jgi:hypothetical protein
MISLFVGLYMLFCRDYRHFHGIKRIEDIYWLDAFLNRFYFVLITFTTIGYGDITPRTKRAKLLTIAIILILMVVVLKTFNGLISAYHGMFDKYNNEIAKDAKKVEKEVEKDLKKI